MTVGSTVTGSSAVLLPSLDAPSHAHDTLAVLVKLPATLALTSSVMAAKLVPTANESVRVHTSVAKVHDQPEPVIDSAVMPLGKISATVTVPKLAMVPVLDTTIEKVGVLGNRLLCANVLGACVLAISRSGDAVTMVVG